VIHRGPWHAGDALAMVMGNVMGLSLLAVSWYGASGQLRPSQQTAWVAAGVVGIVLAGVGNAGFLLTGRRTVGRRQVDVVLTQASGLAGSCEGSRDDFSQSLPVAVAAAGRYHRPDCHLVLGKTVSRASVDDHVRAGRAPCGMCSP